MYQPPPPPTTTITTTTPTPTPTPTSAVIDPALYNPYSAHAHYPSHYTTQPPYFPPFPHLVSKQQQPTSPVTEGPPDLTSITPGVASRVIQRLISAELKRVGFDSAQPDATKRFEIELVALMEQIFDRAHQYANLSNRAGAIATDLLLACEEFNMPPKALRNVVRRPRKKKKSKSVVKAPTLQLSASRPSSPDLLPSDDEGTPMIIPPTLRMLPSHFPTLPPKHTYLRTPISPPKKAALPSLEKKLNTASLVQESLKNLLLATEDNTNQEDAELLGHIVNWEMGVHPRKRWRVSQQRGTLP